MSSPFNEKKYKKLLEGQETSEVRFSDVSKDIFRIDSEPFQKISKNNLDNFLKAKLSEIASINPTKTEISHLDKNTQVSFIPMALLGRGTVNDTEEGTISDFIKSGYTYFSENDVLVAKITPCMEHGKCAIAQNLANGIGFGSTEYNVFRVEDKRILTEYLFVYLNRESVRKQAANHMVGTSGRQRVPTSFYENLLIPILDIKFQERIKQAVSTAHLKREQSQNLYCQAEKLLLSTVDLKGVKLNLKSTDVKHFSESFLATGRLDAEYYQPKYEDMEKLIISQNHSYIFKEFSLNENTIDRKFDEYNYVEIGDISVRNGAYSYNPIPTTELPANAKIKSKKGDLLISKVRPNRGAISIIQDDMPNLVVSGAFTVLEEKADYKKEVLFVLLRTEQYREWMLKYNVCTSYPVIKDEDVLSLPIPLISKKIQQQIANLIQESFTLRRESEQLLEEAKSLVEREIEKGSENNKNK